MMFLVNPAMVNISFGTALLTGVTGYGVVFFGLILLMIVVILVGKGMTASAKQASVAPSRAAQASPAQAAPAAACQTCAPGSAGEVKLYDVPERQAALIMAITAHKLGKPLNELRFRSIREVK